MLRGCEIKLNGFVSEELGCVFLNVGALGVNDRKIGIQLFNSVIY